MINKDKRMVTPEQELQAFALWVMARQRYDEGARFEEQMNAVLGLDDGGHLSDSVMQGAATKKAFDVALARDGVAVEPDTSMT